MGSIKKEDFATSLSYLLKETFEGSPKEGSVYLDTGVGVFNTIEDITAENASKSVAGANIAAHTEHIGYYLIVLANFLRGTVIAADWNRAWEIKTVTDEQWVEIKDKLKIAYETACETIEAFEEWNSDSISQATAIVVHTAYHLGAIRQIAKAYEEKTITISGEN